MDLACDQGHLVLSNPCLWAVLCSCGLRLTEVKCLALGQRLAATLTFSGESTLPTICNHSSLSISRTQMPQGPSLS